MKFIITGITLATLQKLEQNCLEIVRMVKAENGRYGITIKPTLNVFVSLTENSVVLIIEREGIDHFTIQLNEDEFEDILIS